MSKIEHEQATAGFQNVQLNFAAHLRAPDEIAPPATIEPRRMHIYRDLIYNNIESFIAGGFPILRSIYTDERWYAMVRDFVHQHSSKTPYFLQISEEFLHYLQRERRLLDTDPPFLLELAHYEWVELALDVSDAEFPAGLTTSGDVLEMSPVVSPLLWSLSYQYPVHRLGPSFQPQSPPPAPTFLLVYRNRTLDVGFMEVNAATARLLQLAQEGSMNGRQLLQCLAAEIQHPEPTALENFGRELFEKLLGLNILAGLKPV
ncbi:MAG: putative DNA-binding domain-containing protein [Gammaproteobacteria bacterium]|nr:putative DNA-binding domain-containing protein [Gammaproteobacteria bacterium]